MALGLHPNPEDSMNAQEYLAVDTLLRYRCGIGAADAGFSAQDYELDGESPAQWVEWYADKYGLARVGGGYAPLPDPSVFDAFELGPEVRDDEGEWHSCDETEAKDVRVSGRRWVVYGHLPSGGVETIRVFPGNKRIAAATVCEALSSTLKAVRS